MRGKRNTDHNVRKFITIADMSLWAKIEAIMEIPAYSKSFNKVINEALFYGLPILYAKLFETVTEESESEKPVHFVRRIDGANEAYFVDIVRLLKEVILNETINKSILCSLFEAKTLELSGKKISAQNFKDGKFRDTPDYLMAYELKALKDLQR